MVILPCDLSLIAIHISDCRQFSDIHNSQGSVATHLRCGGIFKYESVANLPLSPWAKFFFENRSIFGEVIGKRLVSCFFDWLVYTLFHYLKLLHVINRLYFLKTEQQMTVQTISFTTTSENNTSLISYLHSLQGVQVSKRDQNKNTTIH